MTGREDRRGNDLFFVCSLIEAIGRKTKNHRRVGYCLFCFSL